MRKLKGWTIFPILLVVVLGFWGCAGSPTRVAPEKAIPDLVWPQPPDHPRIRYLGSFSRAEDLLVAKSWWSKAWELVFGKEPSYLERPYGVVTDGKDGIYVVDTGWLALHLINRAEGKYRRIIYAGSDKLAWPIGVAVDAQGRIYLTDADLKRVFVYSPKGKMQGTIGGENLFQRPTGIAYSPRADLLYVADTYAHQVVAFDSLGKEAFRFGKRGGEDGEFNFPVHLFVDLGGEVYVCDMMNYRIQIFDPQGRFLTKFGHQGDGSGDFAMPKGVAVDSEGHIYVVEGLFDVIQVFNRKGELLLVFGGRGNGPGELWLPGGIFIDPQDRIYVADSYNGRVQMFQYLREQRAGEKTEGRGQRGEGRGQRGEGRGERGEGRGQRGEGRGQRGEVRGQRS